MSILDEKKISEGPFTYDDGAFIVYKTRWGTWCSADKDGNGLVTGMDREAVAFFSNQKLRGYPDCTTTVTDTKFSSDSLASK